MSILNTLIPPLVFSGSNAHTRPTVPKPEVLQTKPVHAFDKDKPNVVILMGDYVIRNIDSINEKDPMDGYANVMGEITTDKEFYSFVSKVSVANKGKPPDEQQKPDIFIVGWDFRANSQKIIEYIKAYVDLTRRHVGILFFDFTFPNLDDFLPKERKHLDLNEEQSTIFGQPYDLFVKSNDKSEQKTGLQQAIMTLYSKLKAMPNRQFANAPVSEL